MKHVQSDDWKKGEKILLLRCCDLQNGDSYGNALLSAVNNFHFFFLIARFNKCSMCHTRNK